MFSSPRKLKSTDRVLNQYQDSSASSIDSIIKTPILDGTLITGIELASGVTTAIEHKLNRTIRGWIIVDKDANCNIFSPNTTLRDKIISLQANANVTISLWVF